jgi:Domain of unknown function (DUF1707)/Domain of unknown function (DUF4190)
VPFDTPQPDLRASDADREAAVERLRVAALEGRLDADELEGRLAAAYGARTCTELTALTADVTPPPEPLVFVRPARRVNALAIVSLIAGLLWLGWLGSFAAIATGHIALAQIRRSAGVETGRAAAIAGLCLGYFGLASFLLWLSFH